MKDETYVLKENNETIRQKIKDAGIYVCHCASFVDACWLDYSTRVNNGVHGVGYYGEENGTHSQEEELARFITECEHLIYCKDVDEFITKIKEFKATM